MPSTSDLRNRGGLWLRQWWPVVVVTLAGALAITVAVATRPGHKAPTAVGHLVPASEYDLDDFDLESGTIRLPDGPVDVRVGPPVTDTGAERVRYESIAGREVPDDGSFVPVVIEAGADYDQPTAADYRWASLVPTRVELVADGRTYPLPADPTVGIDRQDARIERSGWVAVAGRPRTLSIAITFDGVRQVLTPATGRLERGRAAQLYAADVTLESPTDRSCGRATMTPGFRAAYRSGVDCDLAAFTRMPYLTGFGWAPAGQRWVALRVDPPTSAVFARRDVADVSYYAFRAPVVRVSLAGATATRDSRTAPALVPVAGSPGQRYVAVFAVPANRRVGPVAMTALFPATNGGWSLPSGAPRSPDVTVTWTKELS